MYDKMSAKVHQKCKPNPTSFAHKGASRTPMMTGIPSIVTVNKNSNCKIIIENNVPYDIT